MAGIAETAENPAPTSEMSKEAKIACRTPASMVTMVLRSVETRNIGDNESLDPTAGVVSVDRPTNVRSAEARPHCRFGSLTIAGCAVAFTSFYNDDVGSVVRRLRNGPRAHCP